MIVISQNNFTFTKNEYMELTLENVQKYLRENYHEDDLVAQLDDEIMNWVDDDWEEECDSEYDWYMDYGRGEAEDVIRGEIITDIFAKFDTDYEPYFSATGEEVWDTINEMFEILNRD